MIKLDRTYSDYTDLDDPNYPNGKAVDCSTDESYDGTPILKELVNDLHGALEAVVQESAGTINDVSGNPDNINASDFKDALMDLIETPYAEHAALRGSGAHGATVAATAGQLMTRDASGRSQVADPVADADIANKGWVKSLRQSFFDAAHPVGEYYVQYPTINDMEGTSRETKTPAECFNVNGIVSTWKELNFAGAFFRANGGLSENFGEGKQSEGLPEIQARAQFAQTRWYIASITNNAFVKNGGGSAYGHEANTSSADTYLDFKASRSSAIYGASEHVTPENYTVRIWVRTA